ncbi:MAG: phosphate acyltransferase PlsX [Chlamydiae bacterium]|nr:phosphate acyltransferase PlsX [Chlamydiota bacterium]
MPKQSNRPIRIGIDLMGHDNAPEALLKDIQKIPLPSSAQLTLIGLPGYALLAPPLSYCSAAEVIEMSDAPLTAVRRKKGSSMCVGLRLLKEHKIDVFISAGNTGALVSAAKVILGMQPGRSRSALITLMPTEKTSMAVLDVGANLEAKASHLVEFAFLGAGFQKERGIDRPTVGLLNVGSEPIKGTSELRAAYELLKKQKNLPFDFVGNIEGSLAFRGDVDVLVTSGFIGNVFLKTSEGAAHFLLKELSRHIPKDVLKPYLARLLRTLNYEEHPGAILAGVRGRVIKCHGSSSSQSFVSAIETIISNS